MLQEKVNILFAKGCKNFKKVLTNVLKLSIMYSYFGTEQTKRKNAMLSMKQYNRFGFNEVDPSENFLDPWWCGDVNYFDVLCDMLESQSKETCDCLFKELKETGSCTMYGEMNVDVTYSIQKGNDPTNVDEYTGNTEFRLEITLNKPSDKYELNMNLVCDLVAETEYDKEIIDTLEQTVKTLEYYSEKQMTVYIERWFDNVAKIAR